MFVGSESTSFLNILFSELSKTNNITVVSQYPIKKSQRVNNVTYRTISSKNKILLLIKTSLLMLNSKCFHFKNFNEISVTRNGLLEKNLKNILKIIKPDIVHIQWASHIKYFENFLNSYKILISLRGRAINILPVVSDEFDKLYDKSFPFITAFHSVSNKMATNLVLNYKIPQNKIKTIYSGLNWELINSIPQKSKISNKFQLISVGRGHWKKNYRLALYGIKQLVNKGFDINYTIIGSDKDEEIIFLINDLQLNEFVELKNNLSHKNVLNQIKKSDLLILPSLEEGIANVVLESLALKTLVVSSDCGGMAEVIQNNKTGFIFKNNDLDEFVEILTKALKITSEEKNKIIQEGYLFVKHQHDKEKMAKEFNELYYSMTQL